MTPTNKARKRKFRTKSESFWSKVDVRGITECWPWIAKGRDKNGYGLFSFYESTGNITTTRSHRFAYCDLFDECVPSGMCVCHSCDNPICCNPFHLFVGTNQENTYDRNIKGRANHPTGSSNAMSKLTEASITEIRRLFVPKQSPSSAIALARKFGVTEFTIHKIVSRRRWSHI